MSVKLIFDLNFFFVKTFLANFTNILVNNLECQDAYSTIANCNKADLYKSKRVKLAKLNQLDKQQKQNFINLHNIECLLILKMFLLQTSK